MNEPPKFNALPKALNRLVLLGIGILTLVLAGAAIVHSPVTRPLDAFFYDRFVTSFSPEPSKENEIIIVDIDDISLAAAGQWPWPRYRIAQLLAVLSAQSPKAMAMDILFPEQDRLSLGHLVRQFKTDFQLDLAFENVPESLTDNDGFLGHVLGQTRTVGARYFYFDHFTKGEICKSFPYKVHDRLLLSELPQAQGAMCNTPKIETGLNRAGFINNQYDPDGLLRQIPLLIQHRDIIFPHLALALFMAEEKLSELKIEKSLTGLHIRAGDKRIPINSKGFANIRFTGPSGQFTYISAIDILNRNFAPGSLREKIILIGSSAVGLNDIHPIIFDPHFPGIEVSAALLDNIHRDNFIGILDWDGWVIGLVCLMLGLTMALIFQFQPTPMALLTGSLAWVLTLTLLSAGLFSLQSLYISPAMPLVLSVLLFIFLVFIRLGAEKRAAFVWFRQLSQAQQLTMEIMVNMVETRDPETGEHIERTQHYARAVALRLREKGLFTETLTDQYIMTLFLSVPLHDIGKVGIPDNILLKPARLTEDEFRHMKLHAVYGQRILKQAAKKIEGSNYLAMGEDIAATHHEKWNGQGYPRGLSGQNIPLSGRIMAIADVYDALISKRCYKPPFPHEKAMAIILEEKGMLFDPVIVEAFVDIEPQIRQIAEELKDETLQ